MATPSDTLPAGALSMNNYTINPISILRNWLVNHPKILHFSWIEGQTMGSSPQFLTFTVLSYLFITFFLSKNRIFTLEPHLRRRITVLHNLILIILSLAMAVGSILSISSYAPNLQYVVCFPKNTRSRGPFFFWAYIFYLSKIYEYMDTVLILLNKSIERLSFLHVYHHALAVIVCYIGLHTSQSSLPLVVIANSSVHVLMYFYYLLTASGFRPKWKMIVTNCQLLQQLMGALVFFFIIIYHFTTSRCSGIWAVLFSGIFFISLFYLFNDFQSKNYSKNGGNKSKKT